MYHDAYDAWSKNEHSRNVQIIRELLVYHRPLLTGFLDRDAVGTDDIRELLIRFDKTDSPLEASPGFAPPPVVVAPERKKASGKGCAPFLQLDKELINLIVQCVNEAVLFEDPITEEHFSAFYAGRPLPAPKAVNNTHVVFFFSLLEQEGLIRNNWKKIIESNNLIISSSGEGFLKASVMSSSLSRVVNRCETADTARIRDLLNRHIITYRKAKSDNTASSC